MDWVIHLVIWALIFTGLSAAMALVLTFWRMLYVELRDWLRRR
jgi:hypothetical protein